MRLRCCWPLMALLWCGITQVSANENDLPPALAPWRNWVLADVANLGCPSPYDNASERIAVWPSTLELAVTTDGGSWTLELEAFGPSWLPLPGNAEAWPMAVTLDGEPAPVVARDGVPSIQVDPGRHEVTGAFRWSRMPERLAIPKTIGIVGLIRDETPVALPERDASGWLWLERSRSAEEEQDQLSVHVARVLEDGRPIWLRTEIELSVSGRSREESIGQVLPAGWQLAAVDGPIPVAVEESGQLRAQVRPGTWRIRLDAFRTDDVAELAFPDDTTAVATEELVGLQVRPEFRVIEFTEAVPVDVAMTRFPDRWRSLPVFRWETARPLAWVVKDRGAGLRKPDRFEISRRLWLDDDGRGLTFEDTIQGECRELSRLDVAAGNELAVVRIDGERQLITTDPDSGAVGVELRSPRPAIEAIGRLPRDPLLTATGWQADADRLQVSLALPPGWRMLAVFGADRVEGDWLTAWTLLDLFLLLVFSLAVYRMRGVAAGLVAFLAFGLAYHELYAPRFTWLFLLAPVALLAVVRSQRAAWWMQAWRLLAMGLLLMHLIPYVTGEVQSALYPQLEPGGIHYRQRSLWEIFSGPRRAAPPGQVQMDAALSASSVSAPVSRGRGGEQPQAGRQVAAKLALFESANMQFAPGTNTQTGIPRPAWQGNQVECSWDGPVSREQTLRLILLPASGHRILAVVRVVLLACLLGVFLRPAGKRRGHTKTGGGVATATALVAAAVLSAQPAAAQESLDTPPAENQARGEQAVGPQQQPSPVPSDFLPSAALLDDLRARLLKPDEAFPHAAEIPEASLKIEGNRLSLSASVHAAAECAVPLPGKFPVWSPLTVRRDGAAAAVIRRDDGHLWVWVPKGVSELTVEGRIPEAAEWILGFQLAPRWLEVDAADWIVSGVNADGRPEGQLFFTRRQQQEAGIAAYDQSNVRGVVQIDRVLEVGLVWKLHTTVRRLSQPGRAISLVVPLVPGERVLSAGTTGGDGTIDVTLAANADAYSWESELPVAAEIHLVAQSSPQAVERWSLVSSPVWNVAISGAGPVYEADAAELIPVWYPWPGEDVTLAFERPQAVDGKTLTIRGLGRTSDLSTRRRSSTLDLRLESSLGGEFFIGLPEEATVRSLQLDGRSLPVRREDGRVLVGLQPGRQQLTVAWTTDESLAHQTTFDPIGLPVEAANVTSQMQLPESRWILWANGPLRGPAVRFWAVLALAAVLAGVLSRPSLSPLKFHEWLLLLVGLTQISLVPAVAVVGWLYLLAWRGQKDPQGMGWFSFDLLQLLLVFLTVMSLITLVVVVSRGLLGTPEMFITGNGSYANRLIWFSPAEGRELGRPWVFSVSIWYYRLLMLLWGLWLANAVIRWLITGWKHFTAATAWRWRSRIAKGAA
jgi:hypothetical protein